MLGYAVEGEELVIRRVNGEGQRKPSVFGQADADQIGQVESTESRGCSQ
jgi:hypothetical protein